MKKLFVLGLAVVMAMLMASSAFAALGFLPSGNTNKFTPGADSVRAVVRDREGNDRSDVHVYDSLANYWYRYTGRYFSMRGWWPNGIWPRVSPSYRTHYHRGDLTKLFWCKGECAKEAEDPIAYPTRAESGMEKNDNVYVW